MTGCHHQIQSLQPRLRVRLIHLLQLRISANEVEPVLSVGFDGLKASTDDKSSFKLLLPMLNVSLYALPRRN